MIERRSLLTGLIALVAAPAVARAATAEREITVDASYQSGNTLVVRPICGSLRAGDIITIDDVFAWYRVDNTPTRRLRQFVVTAAVEPGRVLIPIYPSIIGEHEPRYRTVVDCPVHRAVVRKVLPQVSERWPGAPVIPEPLALAVAAVAVAPVLLEKSVTRRFWGK